MRPALLPELPPDFGDYELLEPPPPLRHCSCRLLRLIGQPQREAGSAARAAAARVFVASALALASPPYTEPGSHVLCVTV